MALISAKDAQFIKDHFQKNMTGEVTVKYFTQHDSPLMISGGPECMFCSETRQILEEVTGLSDKIKLEIYDFVSDAEKARALDITRIPAFTIEGAARGRVRYFGIPSGYEFSSLIEDLVDVSRGKTDLSAETLRELAELQEPVHIQVFTTPT